MYDENHHVTDDKGRRTYTYGLVKINDRQYVKCHEDCCKSGGYPADWLGEDFIHAQL